MSEAKKEMDKFRKLWDRVSNAAKTVSKEDAESCLAYRQKVEDAYAVDPQSIQEHLQSPYMRYAKKMFEKRTTEVEKTLKRKNSK